MTERSIALTIDGTKHDAFPGEPLIHVLSGRNPAWRRSPTADAPRGMFCGMGLCFECTVDVDGRPMRACLVGAREGMQVTTGQGIRPEAPK